MTGLSNVSKRENFLFTVDPCRCNSRVRGGGGGEYFPFVIVVSYGLHIVPYHTLDLSRCK